jgi:hypothetical protein
MEGWSLLISHEKYIKDGKVPDHLGFMSKVFPGSLTDLSAWVAVGLRCRNPLRHLSQLKAQEIPLT